MPFRAKQLSNGPVSGHSDLTNAREDRALREFNRLIAKAAPIARRETATALDRFHRNIAAQIRLTDKSSRSK